MRVGEAKNPGPAGSARVRKEQGARESLAGPFSGNGLEALLRPLLEQLIKDIVLNMLGDPAARALQSLMPKPEHKPSPSKQKPKRTKKPKMNTQSRPQAGNTAAAGAPAPLAALPRAEINSSQGKPSPAKAVEDPAWTLVSKPPKVEKPFVLRQQDWDANLLEFGVVASKLDDTHVWRSRGRCCRECSLRPIVSTRCWL